jgi:hypothetical protein
MYDRELVLIDAETLKHVTTTNFIEMACLNQQVNYETRKVVITTTHPEKLEELPKSIELDLDNFPVGDLFKGANHEGYLYPD